MPRARLQHQPEWPNGDRRLVDDGQLDPATQLHASSQAAQLAVRDVVACPGIGIVEEPARQSVGLVRQRRRDGGEELVVGRAGRCAQPEPVSDVRLADQQQAPRFVGGEAGQMRLEAVDQLDPAPCTLDREDGDAGFAQCLDVAQNGSLGHFEGLGQLQRRPTTTSLQHQQHVENTCGAHRASLELNMTVDVWFEVPG